MKTTFRILTGVIFIVSGLTKIISLDHFELYFYSLQLFGLNASFIFSRLIIGGELVLGALLISGFYRKTIWQLSLGVIFLFSVFLLILLITGYTGNCNCFGEIFSMNPLESLIKNLVIIGFLMIFRKQKGFYFSWQRWVTGGVIVAGVALPFILSPPDFFIYQDGKTVSKPFDFSVVTAEGKEILTSYNSPPLFEGKKIACFFSTGCPFCKKAARKISIMAKKNDFSDKVIYVFLDDGREIEPFFDASQSAVFPHVIIPVKDLLNITHGRIPKVFLLNDGNVETVFTYRGISEKKVTAFFEEE